MGAAFLLVAVFVAIALINNVFLSFDYLIGVMLRNIVELGMMSLAVTLIIITGGIDLSVGSTMVLSAMVGGLVAAKAGSANFRFSNSPGTLPALKNTWLTWQAMKTTSKR
jgi:ribose/xylose/arabinose/galactoside ABC-type transport system permease subunit